MMPSLLYKAFSFLPFTENPFEHPVKVPAKKVVHEGWEDIAGKLWEEFRKCLQDDNDVVRYWCASARTWGGEYCHDHFEWKQFTGRFAYQWMHYPRNGSSRHVSETEIGKMVYTAYEKHKCGIVVVIPAMISYTTDSSDRNIEILSFFSRNGRLLKTMKEEKYKLNRREIFSSQSNNIVRDFEIIDRRNNLP